MSFLEILNSKKGLLIDSYVKQYGEEYRDRITNVVNDTSFVFYINPEEKDYLDDFVCDKLEVIMTFEFLKRIGFRSDDLKTKPNSDTLCFMDDNVNLLLKSFFDNTHFNCIDDFRNGRCGIFSFLDYNDLARKEEINLLNERMHVFNSLGLINILEKDYYEFSKSSLYFKLVNFYRKIALIADKYAKMIEYRYSYIKNLYEDIYSKNIGVKRKYVREMVLELKDFLSISDQEYILNNPDFKLEDLNSIDLIVDDDCLGDTYNSFGVGSLEVFSDIFDRELLDDNADNYDKEAIIEERCNYLRGCGVCVPGNANIFLLNKIMEENKELLPSLETILKIQETRSKYEDLYVKEAVVNMIIESDKDTIIVDDVEDMFDVASGSYCSFFPLSLDCDYDITIFINPMCSYQLIDLDHIIDHELRHAIESNLYMERVLTSKCGNKIAYYDANNEYSDIEHFRMFNEVCTDKLTLMSCKDRWNNGEFIFSPMVYNEEYFGFCDVGSGYAEWFDNLDILLGEYSEHVFATRMEETNERFYKLLSFEEWLDVDKLICDDSLEAREKLKVYSKKLGENIKKIKGI